MYGIGEKVIYGAQGVMEIVDITDQTVGDATHKYYVMKEYASPSSSLTYVPVNNETLTPMHIPRTGILRPRITSHNPLSCSFCIAVDASPTPGSSTLSAREITDGSSVRTYSAPIRSSALQTDLRLPVS